MQPVRPARVVAVVIGCIVTACATHSRLVRQDEDVILRDLRRIISAEAVYEAMNAGWSDRLECLGAPQDCIPGYPKDGPPVLDSTLVRLLPENGYVREFHAGPPARFISPLSSPSSLSGWAYTAVPVKDRRGRKAFCADSSQRICAVFGSAPVVRDGQCGTPCTRIQ
jgi:hypothetical protein